MSALPPIYFERLLEDSPDIVIAVDRKGVIIFYNDGARTALGYGPDEVLGKSVEVVYGSMDHAKAVMEAMRDPDIAAPGKVRNFETTLVARSGEHVEATISGTLIHDAAGREIGSIGFAKDLREIHRQDQLATLGEIAISIAHEINNPITAITNNLTLLQSDVNRLADDDDAAVETERIESVQESVRKIRTIVDRLTEMAGSGQYGTREYMPGRKMADLGATSTERSPADRSRRSSATAEGPLAGRRLLVVDDDLAVLHSVQDVLEAAGADVVSATNGREAQARLAGGRFDLVLSDVVMPDVDGYELYMAVRERYPETPVVLMTAFFYDRDHVIKRSKLDGLDDVLFKKPIDPERLVEIVGQRCRASA